MPVPIPRGFFVSEASAVPDAQTGLRRALDQSAWRTRVFLEGLSPAPPEAPLSAPATAAARVRLLEDRGNSSTWGVECPATGWFVLRDLYWPGWRADVDGRPAAILPADGVFRAVGIGRGEHTIAFRYRPASFGVGVLVSLAALCAFAVIGCRRLFGIAPGAHP